MHATFFLPLLFGPVAQLAIAFPIESSITNGKAIYMMTNAQVNAVVAIPIGPNGLLLTTGKSTPTGGAGEDAFFLSASQPAGPDAIFSQSSVTIAGNNLFAVNPGSNTLSMFLISPLNPTDLTLIGQPLAVPGEFPNSVAVSQKHKLACVTTTGAVAGIACASFSAHGLGPMDSLRPFALGQTTPPVGPYNTTSQVFFSNDESTLFSTVKGIPPGTASKGFLAAFPVHAAAGNKPAFVSQQATLSSPGDTLLLFGSSTIPGSTDIIATDPSFGAAVLHVSGNGVATIAGEVHIDGQMLSCWVAISPATNTAFVTDAAVDRLLELSLVDASIVSDIDLSANGDPGLTDIAAAGRFLYALSPGKGTTPSVTVVDALSKQQVQHFNAQSLGISQISQGMAVLL